MTWHDDRTHRSRSPSAASGLDRSQGGGESARQFVDNRPEADAQRKLQEAANRSKAMPLRALQERANSLQASQAVQLRAIAGNAPVQFMTRMDYGRFCKEYTKETVDKALAGRSYLDVMSQELEIILANMEETESAASSSRQGSAHSNDEEGEGGVLPDSVVLARYNLTGKRIIHGGQACGGGNCHGYAFSDSHSDAYDQGVIIDHLKATYAGRPVTLYTSGGVLMHSAKGVGADCEHKMNVNHPVIACPAAEYMRAMGYERMFELPRQKDEFLKEVGA